MLSFGCDFLSDHRSNCDALYVRFERQEETVLKELENRRKSM